jgi:pSer/pThr/pTyr-binding forkhead associated (FHA) protein
MSLASSMTTRASRDTEASASSSAATEGATERVETVSALAQVREHAAAAPAAVPTPTEPGRYLEIQGTGEARLVRLEREITRIGRGLAADLRLDENSVSRRHALLVDGPSGPRILDDRSSNGTFVNGRRVEQADLSDGDVIVLGRVVLRYLEA